MSNSEKVYVKSGYWIKWKDKGKTFYKCCCAEKDLPKLKAGERWNIYRTGNTLFCTNYPDGDLSYSCRSVKSV